MEVVYLVFTQVPDILPGLSCCVPFIHVFYQVIWTLFVSRIDCFENACETLADLSGLVVRVI